MIHSILDVAERLMDRSDITLLAIGVEATIIAFCAFYAAQFYGKVRMRKEYDLKNDMAKTWLIFFVSQAAMNVLIVYGDYFQTYIPPIINRYYVLNLASVMGLIGLILIARKSEQILGTYYLVTILLTIITVCVVIFYNFPTPYLNLFVTFGYVVLIFIFYAAIKWEIGEIGELKELKKQMKFFELGFIMMAVSQLFRSEFILSIVFDISHNWVYNIRFFADWGLLASLFILQYSFQEFPSLFELEWRKHMKELHIMHMKGGNEIYSHFFVDQNRDNSEIVGGFMYGINQLVSEITGSQTPLNMIKQKENVVVFEKNDKLIVVLIAKEYNQIYTIKLKRMLNMVMERFGGELDNWNGNRTMFKPIEGFTDKIFK